MSGLILFVEGRSAIEIEATATCKELYEIADLGSNFLTFQGQKLPYDSTPIADTGISSQITLGIKTAISIVEVEFMQQDAEFETIWGDDDVWASLKLLSDELSLNKLIKKTKDRYCYDIYVIDSMMGNMDKISGGGICSCNKYPKVYDFIQAFVDSNPSVDKEYFMEWLADEGPILKNK